MTDEKRGAPLQKPDPGRREARRRRRDGGPTDDGSVPERSLRRVFVSFGVVLFFAALLPEVRNFPTVDVGRSQWLLIALAGGLLVFGFLGRRRKAAYHGFALVLLNTLLAALVVEVASSAANLFLSVEGEPAPVEFETARANPYFADKPWADAFWAEQRGAQGRAENYHPYVIWRGAPYQGQFVRVDESGLRHTEGATCSDDDFRIAMFGSSALWGWGVPDDATIASFLQARLADQGRAVCVLNRGQNGWVSTQDLIDFVRMVQAGERVDLAVFFHGFNDAGAIFETRDAGAHYMVEKVTQRLKGEPAPTGLMPILASTATGRLVQNLLRTGSRPSPRRWSMADDEVPQWRDETIRAYLANLEAARGIGQRAGIAVEFFWQPYADWRRTPEERLEVPDAGSFTDREALIQSVYVAVRDTSAAYPDLHFLADDFADAEPSDWLDWVHLAPSGNERAADLILGHINDRLPEAHSAAGKSLMTSGTPVPDPGEGRSLRGRSVEGIGQSTHSR